MAIWDEPYETMARDDMVQLQLERLQATLNRAYKNVPYYRQLFDDYHIIPEEMKSLKDLSRIPFTTKLTMRDAYPYGMLAVPLREIVRIHSSLGTTGKPTVVGYSRNDLKHWSEVTARILTAAGVSKDDVVQIAFDYGLMTSGFGIHYGAELIGASVIPTSTTDTEKQVLIMRDYRTTTLVCTPSFAFSIGETMERMAVSPNELSLRYGLFGGEQWSESMRKLLEAKFFINAFDIYGLSEIFGPGIAGECQERRGLHIFEDHFIPEIIEPKTGQALLDGQVGELVLTTITKEALPLIRFRTGDLTRLFYEPCACGRGLVRMEKISGRTDDMIIVRGISFFPYQIEEILRDIEHAEPHFQLIIDREGAHDVLEILVEVSDKIFFDEMKKLVELEEKTKQRIEEKLGLSAKVKLVEPKTLAQIISKENRVIDRRTHISGS